ncbi:P-loop NTPase fold protein [Cryobacterium sp. PAMC25264]|uniref:KAP family P-loop NTPase fold protein n=1 Tax=Cryobacterium sp. PAMC25264 TaxID=2861288 RepID=UPI001C633C5D|nr:P-loop NTPase fold protein [Cryobacterium sp. PAMC25264]QYF74759.1 KAP family NTPase [Cryobacterium sp. PAMC25264]
MTDPAGTASNPGTNPESWLSDDPGIATPPIVGDFLDRRIFVSAVTNVMDRARTPGGSSVFGLIGPWGSGKTTILNLLSSELEGRSHGKGVWPPAWVVSTFNPWMHSDAASLHRGFFSELRDALPKDEKWDDAQARLDGLRTVVTPLAGLASLFAPGIKDVADGAFDALKSTPSKIREEAAKALLKLDRPILMILDDLDRLTSNELLEVFKLVRFIGRLPNVYYLLCYDERTLADLIESTELVGSKNDGRAMDYLEKIVQIRFDIPPMRMEQSENIFSAGMNSLLERNGIVSTRQDENRVRPIFISALGRRLDTPRAIRRYLGQIEAFLPSVADEVDWVDFALLTWIRTLEPSVYGRLQRDREFLVGSGTAPANDKSSLKLRTEQLTNLLGGAQISQVNRESLLEVLAELFPAVKLARDGRTLRELHIPAGRRVANAEYFDRYFLFGIPSDDIADFVVSKAVRDIISSVQSTETDRLDSQLLAQTGRTIRKVDQERPPGEEPAERIALWLGSLYSQLPEDSHGFFSSRDQVEQFFARMLVETSSLQAKSVVQQVAGTVPGTSLTVEAIALMANVEVGTSDDVERWHLRGSELMPLLAQISRNALDGFAGSLANMPSDIWITIWRWGTADRDAVRSYIETSITSNRWSVLDVLAKLVSSAVPHGVPGAVGVISGFDAKLVGELVDLDLATERLAKELESAPPGPVPYRAEATMQNRRSYVLEMLRGRKEQYRAKLLA